ncbi:MAG: AMP-binding protein, partial [Acidobacteriota bacterium]
MIYLLSHLVERAAEREAERDAYRVPGRGIRYAELARRAHRLAHALRADGVRRGDRVGIFMPRDLDSAVAVHGILAAGAVFVPIDPHAPAGALRRLTDDCELRHLISHPQQARTLQRLAEDGATGLRTIVGLDGDRGVAVAEALGVAVRSWNDLDAYPDGARPDLRVMEDDLAYLMYSSGSTGRPKGIVHTHRSGLAYARLSAATYAVVPEDRIGNHSPLHFDMSTFGYLTSPLVGATTLLIPEAYTKLAASLSQLIEKEQLTIWYSVPLALIQLATRGVLDERDLSSLRWVLFGGEPFARQHLHALMARWPNARFSNVYGPAEVNQCTYYHVPPPAEDADLSEPVPIGTIWDDTEGLILDDDDRPIEDDTPGELVIRSPTRMRGYWGRPDLDARAFYRRSAVGG